MGASHVPEEEKRDGMRGRSERIDALTYKYRRVMARGWSVALLGFFALQTLPFIDCARYGDRPGQLRESFFSSYGHKVKWGSKDTDGVPLGQKPAHPGDFEIIEAGTRQALELHMTDVIRTKKDKLRARKSALGANTREEVLAYMANPKTTKNELLRVLRLSKLDKSEIPPAGHWTAKSHPTSLLPGKKVKKIKVELVKPGRSSSVRSQSVKARSGSARSQSVKRSKSSKKK